MATRVCSVCGQTFKIFAIEDKSRHPMPVEVKCPTCGAINLSEVSARTYVVLKDLEVLVPLPRQPNPNNGEEYIP